MIILNILLMIDVDKFIIKSIKKAINNELKNHRNFNKTYGFLKPLTSNHNKSTLNPNINKPIKNPQYYKIINNYSYNNFNPKIINSSQSINNNLYFPCVTTDNVALLDEIIYNDLENEKELVNHTSKDVDIDFEFKLLEYEGYNDQYLNYITRLFKVLRLSSESNLLSELEIKVRNLYNNLDFVGLLHLSAVLRSIYKTEKSLNYSDFLQNVLKYLNYDEIKSLYSFKRYDKVTARALFKPDSKLEEDVQYLLESISSSNPNSFIASSTSNGEFSSGNSNRKYNIMNYDELDYDKYFKKENKTKDFVYHLTPESLSKLTNYSIIQVSFILDYI
ncbi:uncharacterized protein TA03285 [Theileria annulata]|uniref:Uncharacterized protein n=1 Tax=Theileria annulata TaxID=5874 RepID=Q4UCN7_THEAN|nr:uncharacterized protein TA03285 [Theileria annulata]CAI75414.1 hypothetical protein, conserved [Theileria annulata]|eukprot:XP_954890.1 hypothetical protein, conserved [Theileria annulata]